MYLPENEFITPQFLFFFNFFQCLLYIYKIFFILVAGEVKTSNINQKMRS
jgi:hypothetical protein